MENKQIAKALLEAQKEMGIAIKDSNNPFFKSKYADLNAIREACMPALNKHGISVLQPIVPIDGKNFVRTVLLHESGESFDSFTEIVYSKQNDAQAQGSGITYARRYGLQSLVNVGAEDDDGNQASTPQEKTTTTQEKTQTHDKKWLNPNTLQWDNAIDAIKNKGKKIEDIKSVYNISKANQQLLEDASI